MLGRIAPLVTVAACVAALAGHVAAVDATSSGAEFPHLRAVSARDDGGVSAVVIEATEPVAYVTSQPDPLTVLVDLRNVRAGGIKAGATARELTPLRGVRVEESTAADGTPVARVRVTLERATAHRVRTSRNLIVVEVDRQAPARADDARVVGRCPGQDGRCGRRARARTGRTEPHSGAAKLAGAARSARGRDGAGSRCRARRHGDGARPSGPGPECDGGGSAAPTAPDASSPAIRSRSISRAPTCARCSAPSRRSAA